MVYTTFTGNLAKGVAPTAAAAAYTAPADETVGIKSVYIFNYSAADRVVKMYATDSPSSPATADQIDQLTLKPGTGKNFNIAGILLEPSESLVLTADAATSVSYRVAGSRITNN